MIEIINRQRHHKINLKAWRDFTQRTLQTVGSANRSVTVVFVGSAAIKKLNQDFRGQNYSTDVLSFPTEAETFESEDRSKLGEVVICLERAQIQSRENGLTFANEVQQLILHGVLHLCGYDHETDHGEMNRLELKLRKKLGI
jgi:probable rRNA maturation factor